MLGGILFMTPYGITIMKAESVRWEGVQQEGPAQGQTCRSTAHNHQKPPIDNSNVVRRNLSKTPCKITMS